jgi:hypothetical protein
MAARELDARVATLEAEVARSKQRLERTGETKKHWVDTVYGAFANDPDFSGHFSAKATFEELQPTALRKDTRR